MPAYVIAETDVHDPEQYERYKAVVPSSVAAAGGRFVVRGYREARRLREGAATLKAVAAEGL